jgi:predicted nucleic acid-binding protein
MIVALDTNVLVYAEGLNGGDMKELALDLLERLPPASTLLPLQTLGELFSVLVRKAGRSRAEARAAILAWGDTYPLIETSSSVISMAGDLSVAHQLGFWDAVVLSAAADARCRLLLSEDLQDGFTWGGVTVVNPFSPASHKLLDAFLRGASSGAPLHGRTSSPRKSH